MTTNIEKEYEEFMTKAKELAHALVEFASDGNVPPGIMGAACHMIAESIQASAELPPEVEALKEQHNKGLITDDELLQSLDKIANEKKKEDVEEGNVVFPKQFH